MGVIAENTEDYISFSIKVEVDKYVDKEGNKRTKEMELRFIDSIKFMSSSLDSLVNNLARGGHEFWGFENYNELQRKLLVHVPNFGGLSGSEDRGGGDNSIQFINFGRVGDKSFEEWRQKIRGGGGGRVGENNILTFSSYCTR